jgi:hypothetical protein
MKCPHCGMHFHDNWLMGDIARGNNTGWFYRTAVCPACKQITVQLCPPLRPAVLKQLQGVTPRDYSNVRDKLILKDGEWRQRTITYRLPTIGCDCLSPPRVPLKKHSLANPSA